MTLIDRYLRAVRDHLPREQQDDIINELSDSLHSRFEDEEAAKGRPLLEDEEVAILRAYGHPMAVAARYRGDERTVTFGQRLIGPELFPIYMKVLAVNVGITVLIGIIALVAGAQIWPGFAGIVVPLALQFAIVTAIFVVIDRRWISDPDGWDPRTVNAMGPDVDVSTSTASRPSCSARSTRGPSHRDIHPGDRGHRGGPDRGPADRPARSDRLHGARTGLA